MCWVVFLDFKIKDSTNKSQRLLEQFSQGRPTCLTEQQLSLCESRNQVLYQQGPVFWSEIWMWASVRGYIRSGSDGWTGGLVSMWCWEAGWLGRRGWGVMQASHFVQNKVSVPPYPSSHATHTHKPGAPHDYISWIKSLSPPPSEWIWPTNYHWANKHAKVLRSWQTDPEML